MYFWHLNWHILSMDISGAVRLGQALGAAPVYLLQEHAWWPFWLLRLGLRFLSLFSPPCLRSPPFSPLGLLAVLLALRLPPGGLVDFFEGVCSCRCLTVASSVVAGMSSLIIWFDCCFMCLNSLVFANFVVLLFSQSCF